ncbi:MAG: hypothetical protein AAGB25_01005 [Pseudomonadota bacterium]
MRAPSPFSLRNDRTRLADFTFISLAKIAFAVGGAFWVPMTLIMAFGGIFTPGGFTVNGAEVEGAGKFIGLLIWGALIGVVVNGFVAAAGALSLRIVMTLLYPGGGQSPRDDRLVR